MCVCVCVCVFVSVNLPRAVTVCRGMTRSAWGRLGLSRPRSVFLCPDLYWGLSLTQSVRLTQSVSGRLNLSPSVPFVSVWLRLCRTVSVCLGLSRSVTMWVCCMALYCLVSVCFALSPLGRRSRPVPVCFGLSRSVPVCFVLSSSVSVCVGLYQCAACFGVRPYVSISVSVYLDLFRSLAKLF